MADIRASTLPVRSSSNGVTVLGYMEGGAFTGLHPAALQPTLAQLGGASQSDVNAALLLKQDTSQRGLANGYAALDGAGKVPAEQLPALGEASLSNNDPLPLGSTTPGTATTTSRSDHRHPLPSLTDLGAAPVVHTHAISAVTGLQIALDAKELTSNRGAINGYAPLDSNGKVPSANLPPGISQASLDAKADTTYVNSQDTNLQNNINAKANTTDVNTALAAKADSNDARIVNAVQPGHLTPVEDITGAYSVVQADANKIKRCTSATDIVVTLPARSVGTTVRFFQAAAGKMTFTAGTNQTVNNFSSLFQSGGINANVIATVVSANVWNVSGDLI